MQSTTEETKEKKKNYAIKTISIPKWQNLYVEKFSINLSKLTQKALEAQIKKSGIDPIELKKEAVEKYGLDIDDLESW